MKPCRSLFIVIFSIIFFFSTRYIYYTGERSEKSGFFIYYNKPYKTASSAIKQWLEEMANDNNLRCARCKYPVNHGDEAANECLLALNWTAVDCYITHMEMNRLRWGILKEGTKNRNLISITSVRNPLDRFVSWANEVVSINFTPNTRSGSRYSSLINHSKFPAYLRHFGMTFDGRSLYRYYCEEMDCTFKEIRNRFTHVIDLWDANSGLNRLVVDLRRHKLKVKNPNIAATRVRGSNNSVNASRIVRWGETFRQIEIEQSFYDALKVNS